MSVGATDDRSVIYDRLVKLEGRVDRQDEESEGQAGIIDHMQNTMESILLPTQAAHSAAIAGHQKVLDEHAESTREAHDYIMSQRGAWALVQKGGIVVAALASAVTLVMKILEQHAK